MFSNLNRLRIRSDGPDVSLVDLSLSSGEVTAYFRDIESHFLRHCSEADGVVGCVAWLTNATMLRMLADKKAVSIVVQKEDFLRIDASDWDAMPVGWKLSLRFRYERLRAFDKVTTPGVSHLSFCNTAEMDAVRCVGNHNSARKVTHPRMHNKFVVFCKLSDEKLKDVYGDVSIYEPYAVWTGSFNFSENSCNSFENVVVIENKEIAQAYYDEWAQIIALSEPLDWTSEWCEPEWRIGT